MCGGAHNDRPLDTLTQGLSPRVRGSLALTLSSRRVSRSIPTCAGEPGFLSEIVEVHQVYPHVCGGAVVHRPLLSGSTGLSPRVRGSRMQGTIREREKGSIPTCAGEPIRRLGATRPTGVYPHVCGGADSPTVEDLGAAGLSPRVRGSRQRSRRTGSLRRSIPTCAGEPAIPALGPDNREVYPHVCGGALQDLSRYCLISGLSPRVRGSRWRSIGLTR